MPKFKNSNATFWVIFEQCVEVRHSLVFWRLHMILTRRSLVSSLLRFSVLRLLLFYWRLETGEQIRRSSATSLRVSQSSGLVKSSFTPLKKSFKGRKWKKKWGHRLKSNVEMWLGVGTNYGKVTHNARLKITRKVFQQVRKMGLHSYRSLPI